VATVTSEIVSTGIILYTQAPSLTKAMLVILPGKFVLQWALERGRKMLYSWVAKGQLHGDQEIWKLFEKEGLWSLRCFGKEFHEYNEYSRNLVTQEHRESQRAVITNLTIPVSKILDVGARVLSFYFGGQLVLRSELDPEQMLQYVAMARRLFGSSRQLLTFLMPDGRHVRSSNRGLSDAAKIMDTIERRPRIGVMHPAYEAMPDLRLMHQKPCTPRGKRKEEEGMEREEEKEEKCSEEKSEDSLPPSPPATYENWARVEFRDVTFRYPNTQVRSLLYSRNLHPYTLCLLLGGCAQKA
jgi:ABC-type multidrug transport system fused ATPase/permease subunit